jgi:DNA-binding SARP family transcriptional activator/tetratricopeptide (TPR) repeat protein
MEFRILGPLEAWEGGSPVALGGAKQRALLAVLLLHANEVVSTELLIDLLWMEPPAKATKAVQVYASRLRKALGGQMPTSRPPGYLLELPAEQFDLANFRRLREEARRDPPGAPEKLAEALALWRGQALAEFAGEPFAQVERGRLEEERLEALEERIEAELALGRHATLIGELEALVATHPLRERLRRQLMIALYRCDRQADALAAYREARSLLVEELGIEPGRALQQLEHAILRQDAELDLAPISASPFSAPARSVTPDQPSPPLPRKREERKLVSVLFVELVSHGGRGEKADPEDMGRVLRGSHKVVRQEIERFGGTIESVVGESMMAVFGTPAHEDDAERAVRAALAIRRLPDKTDDDLQVRLSVDTGMALVSVGERRVGEPLIVGNVVGNARRLLAAAPVGAVLVGDQTHGATLETIDYSANAPIGALGSEKVPAWKAMSARARRGADLLREPRTPLVGRGRELALLASALDRAVDERSPQLITLVGVPGIGKSRLAFELSRMLEHDRRQITWLQGRCLSYGDGVSAWALGEIVKAQAGILESDSLEQAKDKLRGAVAEVLAIKDEATWVERELRPFIGGGSELHPGEREESFPAWRRFLEGLAELRPLVLVLEDLHWADDGLLEFVDELAARLRDAPLLLLCTARPELLERRPGWGGGKPNALTISLAPLPDEETKQLANFVLGQPLPDDELVEELPARTGGNPLYVEQFARLFAEIGSLEQLPETVHGIIAARLDGLLPEEKALLEDAAVVGKIFWSGAIASLGEVTRQQAEELLVALERREFVQRLRRSSVAGDSEYSFRHILLRDVAYAHIPRAARAEKHHLAARWIETLGRPDDHAEMLAHHYSSALAYTRAAGGEDPFLVERARLALRSAGDRALAVASYTSAAHFYGAALVLWPDDDAEHAWLLVHAGHARHAADGTGIDLLEQGFDELRSRGGPEDAAEVAVEVARRFWLIGDRDAAYSYIGRALELVEGHGTSRARAYALVERAAYHMNASEHREAIRLVREALPLTEALSMDDLHVRALDVLGSSRASLGDLGGLQDAHKAVELARDRNAFYRLVVAELNLQGLLVFGGRLPAASEALQACREDVERYGTADQRNWLRAVEAHESVLYGHWNEAVRILDERIAEAKSGVTHYSDPCCLALRASIALARGDLEAATSDSERALEGALRIKDPQLLAPALTMRAIVQLSQGRWEEASTLASEVLQQGAVFIPALLELHPTVTPIELAWLVRDLGCEASFLSVLELVPSTPWHDAARAIADGDFTQAVTGIGAPSVDAYTRLRAAEGLTRVGRIAEAKDCLEPALNFFGKVGAARYLALAEALLAAP